MPRFCCHSLKDTHSQLWPSQFVSWIPCEASTASTPWNCSRRTHNRSLQKPPHPVSPWHAGLTRPTEYINMKSARGVTSEQCYQPFLIISNSVEGSRAGSSWAGELMVATNNGLHRVLRSQTSYEIKRNSCTSDVVATVTQRGKREHDGQVMDGHS